MVNSEDRKYYAAISTKYYEAIMKEIDRIKSEVNKSLFPSRTINQYTHPEEKPSNVTDIKTKRGNQTPGNVEPLFQKPEEELEIG